MVMHDVTVAEASVNRTQKRVDQRFQMLRAECAEPDHFHAAVFCDRRGEVTSAIDRHFMAAAHESSTDFFVVSFYSAIFADYSASTDKGNVYGLLCDIICWNGRLFLRQCVALPSQ